MQQEQRSSHNCDRNKAAKLHLSIIFINSVQNVDYEQADGSAGQYMLIRIPHRSLNAYRKVGSLVQEHLEQVYERPVMVVANRTILSPSGKYLRLFLSYRVFLYYSPLSPIPDETKIKNSYKREPGNPRRCRKYLY